MAKATWDMLMRQSEEEANKLKMDSEDLARKRELAEEPLPLCIPGSTGFTGGYTGGSDSKIHMDGRDAGITCLVPLASTWPGSP